MGDTLYVNGRFYTQPLSGVQRFAIEITKALVEGYGDRVVVLGPKGAQAKQPFVRVAGHGNGQVWEQLELPKHVVGGMLINLGNTAPLRPQFQLVVIHDAGIFATPEAYSWKYRLYHKVMQRLLMLRRVRVVTVSEFGRSELVRCLGIRPEQVGVVSEGADHMAAIAADDRIMEAIPPGRFVLAVGNLAAHKNLAALSELGSTLAGRGLTLVITGGLAARAFSKARPDTLPQPACYVGRVSDEALKALYERAACLVFPSRYEGFGLPAVEAMACGCPVVASRIPALQETCGEAALYIDPGSPGDIARQVCRLLDDPAVDGAMRAAARDRVRAFTWARAARQLAAIAGQGLEERAS